MENYKNSSEAQQDLILLCLKTKMKEQKISRYKLSEMLKISETTLWRYFTKKTPMPLVVYLEIKEILKN